MKKFNILFIIFFLFLNRISFLKASTFHDEIAKFLFKLINKRGIINVGGKKQTVYSFVKKYNPNIKKISAKKIFGKKYPLNPSMNINKLKKLLND